MKAMEVFCGNSRAAAGARCIVKRTLRKMRLPANLEPHELAEAFIANPWQFSTGIERAIDASVKAYERNDSKTEQWKAEEIEVLFALLDVNLTWPGLYPTYVYMGEKPVAMPPGCFARESYDLSGLWWTIREVRKYQEGGK